MTRQSTRTWTGFVAINCLLAAACSGGDNASGPQTVEATGGFGFATGGNPSAGGFNPSAGGFNPSAGGALPGSGGFYPGAGGFYPGAGGFYPGAGGYVPGAGGFNPGAGGADPSAGGAPPGSGGAPPAVSPPCITNPAQEAAILGDSVVTGFLSPTLLSELGKVVPATNQYGFYAGAGCSMASGGICTGAYGNVPAQSTAALQRQPDLEFVIMDGGGNDILLCDTGRYPGCNTICNRAGAASSTVCTGIVQAAVAASETLMTASADAGVRDVIYFFYPHIPAQSGGYTEILDYSLPLAKAACDGAEARTGGKMRCHFIDLVPPFAAAGGDRNPLNFAGDGIHPSMAGQVIIAREIANLMQARCLGQTSGCCTP